jgi:hypothetical protein
MRFAHLKRILRLGRRWSRDRHLPRCCASRSVEVA